MPELELELEMELDELGSRRVWRTGMMYLVRTELHVVVVTHFGAPAGWQVPLLLEEVEAVGMEIDYAMCARLAPGL